jgi:large subunit ribosomal protein L2
VLGKKILISNSAPIISGNSLPLENIPLGTAIHSIEIKKNGCAQLARAAGTFAKIIKRDSKLCTIRLNSGVFYEIPSDCLATIGIVANVNHKNVKIGKAGRSRWLNKRPIVRGVVMNPVDHPHGGGEGKTSGGRCSVTPWGIPTKGFKTRRKKKK